MSMLLAAAGQDEKLYVDDVFSAYTYTGNSSTQTINNGIDLAGKGGLVWSKCRGVGIAHSLEDTIRGTTKRLLSESTAAEVINGDVTSYSSTGYTLGFNSGAANSSGQSFVSWTFRKSAKFFDIVTYTGDGTSNRQIAHNLGIAPGMIIVKAASVAGQDWMVYHRSLSANGYLILNSTGAANTYPYVFDATDTDFKVASSVSTNGNGTTYVAYLFAHDTSTDGIIQCGSFTTDGSGNASVNLGWEPQYVLWKNSTGVAENWYMTDNMRGMSMTRYGFVVPNASDAEYAGTLEYVQPTATGITFKNQSASKTWVYLAIRRPNKPPTTGTQVYNAIARTGTGAAATVTGVGFAPDLVMAQIRGGGRTASWYDRLRGKLKELVPSNTNAEFTHSDSLLSFDMNGCSLGADVTTSYRINASGSTYINHFFKRAVGVFDIVCYTGTGSTTTVAHGLGVVPELMIVKSRSNATGGYCYHTNLGNNTYIRLFGGGNEAASTPTPSWNYTNPTNSVFSVTGFGYNVNESGYTYAAYLFATKAGISKVGSYTGNGTSQTIDCGFTTGARFVLIKRTDSTGDWYVWDTVRGIVAGNDPHLSLNTTAAEVTTDDSIDPVSSGFIVNQNSATNINVNGGTYIFLAFA